MKKIILLVVLALIGVAAWYIWETRKRPKNEVQDPPPVAVSKHTEAFNTSINNALKSYYALSESFVNWDSAAVSKNAAQLKNDIDSIRFADIQKDTVIYQTAMTYPDMVKNDIDGVLNGTDITAKRRAFHSLSQNFYDLLRIVRYDEGKIYLQECPMAFNDDETAIWLSKNDEIRNPYLGLHHPKYGKTMLSCGNNKDTLNFTQSQTP